MKLPNFYDFEPLNSLKERMGLAREDLGALDVHVGASRLTAAELERLTSQDGLDISSDQLRILDDGTLAYKDSRVLLYIRDVSVMGNVSGSQSIMWPIVRFCGKCESERGSTVMS